MAKLKGEGRNIFYRIANHRVGQGLKSGRRGLMASGKELGEKDGTHGGYLQKKQETPSRDGEKLQKSAERRKAGKQKREFSPRSEKKRSGGKAEKKSHLQAAAD